jgi:Ca2+-binding EF-hand superfamily protein
MKICLTSCLLALATGFPAMAQRPDPPQGRRPSPVPPLFAVIDADQDRVLNAAEIENASDTIIQLDRNGDGEITLDELLPPPRNEDDESAPTPPPRAKPAAPPVITALDTDRDGTLSAGELEGAPESLKTLDKNADGELSPDELRPARTTHGPKAPSDRIQSPASDLSGRGFLRETLTHPRSHGSCRCRGGPSSSDGHPRPPASRSARP